MVCAFPNRIVGKVCLQIRVQVIEFDCVIRGFRPIFRGGNGQNLNLFQRVASDSMALLNV